jgi:hypothetical protein
VRAFERGHLAVEPLQQDVRLPHDRVESRVGALQVAKAGLERAELHLEPLALLARSIKVALVQRLLPAVGRQPNLLLLYYLYYNQSKKYSKIRN